MVRNVLIEKQYVRSGDPYRVCQAEKDSVNEGPLRPLGNKVSTHYENGEPNNRLNIGGDEKHCRNSHRQSEE